MRTRDLMIKLWAIPRSPGSVSGVDISTPTTSRKFRPSPKPASNAAITVAAGLEYSLDGGATWTSNPGTWGTARYCMVRLTSSGSYSDPVTKAITIAGTALNFTVTTMADPLPITDGWIDETGAAYADENGSIWA